jgi:hypothetical protein
MLKKNVMLFMVVIAIIAISGAVNAASISIVPDDQTVLLGDIVQIDISGSDFNEGTFGGGLTVDWDPSVLQFVSLSTDPFPGDKFFGSEDTTNASAGSLSFSVGSFFDGAPGPSFDIATLMFNAVGLGNDSLIDLDFLFGDVWVDSNLTELDPQPTLNDGLVTVNAVPIPPAILLLGGGLLGLIGIRRKKS